MLIDANLLLYARDEDRVQHGRATRWLAEQLAGPARVGLPWSSLLASVRISTHPRAVRVPLRPADAWDQVKRLAGCARRPGCRCPPPPTPRSSGGW